MFSALFRCSPSARVYHVFSRQQLNASRHISLFNKKTDSLILVDKAKHNHIYSFNYIRLHASFPKLKSLTSLATCIAIPVAFTIENGYQYAIAISLLGAFNYFFLGFLAKLSRGIIGIISVNKGDDVEEIIISSIDERGRRIDRRHKPKDLVVCGFASKIGEALNFATIKDVQLDIVYKLNTRNCQVLDKKTFASTFGKPETW